MGLMLPGGFASDKKRPRG